MRVALFATCLGDQLFPDAVVASVRLLRWLGVQVDFPEAQTCCGQPAYSAGYLPEARALARQQIRALEGTDHVVVPSGSCAAMLARHLGPLFEEEPETSGSARELGARTHDLAGFVRNVLGVREVGADLGGETVTYHDGCHVLRVLGVREAPRDLLRGAGAELVESDGADVCCGFGGLFSVKQPEVSGAMARAKHHGIRRSGATTLTSQDLGCLAQLSGSLRRDSVPVRSVHLAELLWEGIQRAHGASGAPREVRP